MPRACIYLYCVLAHQRRHLQANHSKRTRPPHARRVFYCFTRDTTTIAKRALSFSRGHKQPTHTRISVLAGYDDTLRCTQPRQPLVHPTMGMERITPNFILRTKSKRYLRFHGKRMHRNDNCPNLFDDDTALPHTIGSGIDYEFSPTEQPAFTPDRFFHRGGLAQSIHTRPSEQLSLLELWRQLHPTSIRKCVKRGESEFYLFTIEYTCTAIISNSAFSSGWKVKNFTLRLQQFPLVQFVQTVDDGQVEQPVLALPAQQGTTVKSVPCLKEMPP